MLEAAPDADVVIAGHTGFDGLDTFGGILRRLESGAGDGRMWFRRIPRADLPADGIVEWLEAKLPTEVKEAPKQAPPEPGALKG